MSTNDKTSSAPTKTRMTGAEVLVECLVREGVDVVFALRSGGASMPIHQALSHQPKIRTILPRHEQGGAFGAEGYGRVTSKGGRCISTSGPGATNMITSIADAYLDSYASGGDYGSGHALLDWTRRLPGNGRISA